LYTIDLSSASLENGATLEKTFVRDLIPDFTAAGGLMPEKLEGLAVDENGVWVINDNDGVDDNSGETQLLNLGKLGLGQNLKGTNGKDKVFGSVDDDRLLGRNDNDRLTGGDGNDILIGGKGVDRLTGGDGDDTFVLKRGDLRDRADKIFDFEVDSDVIDVQKVFRGGKFNSDTPFDDYILLGGTGNRTKVAIDQNGNEEGEDYRTLVVLRGVDVDTVDADSFLF